MESQISSYEKGLALELKLCELFRSKGYNVYHNVKRVGKSGVEHQIDVLAEYRCPLHVSTLVIEAKSYDKPVDKDRVMKLFQIVNDIGADRGILVTTSYFTPAALKTAEKSNIELWDRKHLIKLLGEAEIVATEKGLSQEIQTLEGAIQPIVTHDEAYKIFMEKRARAGFLAREIVEEIKELTLVYLPYYDVELEVKILEEQKTGIFSKKLVEKIVTKKISVSALTGALVNLNENSMTFYDYIPKLNEDEIKVLRLVGSSKFDVSKVLALGFSEGKAKKILNTLVGKSILERIGGRPITYKAKVQFPSNPLELRSISEFYPIRKFEIKQENIILPLKELSAIIKILELLWSEAKVKNVITVYHPYWACLYESKDGSKRVGLINALNSNYTPTVSGKINDAIIKILKTNY